MFNGPFSKINTAILLDKYIKAYEGVCDLFAKLRDTKGDTLKISGNMLKLLAGEKELSEVNLPESKIPKEELQKKSLKSMLRNSFKILMEIFIGTLVNMITYHILNIIKHRKHRKL